MFNSKITSSFIAPKKRNISINFNLNETLKKEIKLNDTKSINIFERNDEKVAEITQSEFNRKNSICNEVNFTIKAQIFKYKRVVHKIDKIFRKNKVLNIYILGINSNSY